MQLRVEDGFPARAGREFGLADIVMVVGRRLWLVVAITLLGGVLATVAALMAPRMYRASVLLVPVSAPAQGGLGALSSMAGQIGGISSLIGLSLSPAADGKTEAIAALQSAQLTRQYIQQNNLLPTLFEKQWNADSKKWKTAKVPTLWQANEYFAKRIRNVNEDSRSGVVTLTITWKDPVAAAKWANSLVDLVNEHLRNRAIEEEQRAISYLRVQADSTGIVELRSAIYSLMKSEIEKEMLARGREQYALKIVDPAIAPERHSSPSVVLWVLAGIVAGFALAVVAVLVIERKAFGTLSS